MPNDFGKNYVVEDCYKISVYHQQLTGVSYIEVDKQQIDIAWSACNYGGQRPWFICPVCYTRVGVLYRKPLADGFLCRYCSSLSYRLQRYHRSQFLLSK